MLNESEIQNKRRFKVKQIPFDQEDRRDPVDQEVQQVLQ